MIRRSLPLLVSLALLALGGCRRPGTFSADCGPNPGTPELAAARRDSLPPADSTSNNTRGAELARRFPGGYAGFWYVNPHRTIVYFADTTLGRTVADTILKIEQVGHPLDTMVVEMKQIRWNYAQLDDWYRYLQMRVWEDYHTRNGFGLNTGYINTHRNVLAYHVNDSASVKKLERYLESLELPCGLVDVRGPGEGR